MRKHTLALVLCGSAATAFAQPVMSRGQQQLAIDYNECLKRAQGALRNVGFNTPGPSGDSVNGFKDASGAYIICQPIPGSMVVHIVVATVGNDAGVPGSLRQSLQAQMERPTSTPPVSGTHTWMRSGEGDCAGSDVGSTAGSNPDATWANRAAAAICWDGRTYNNAYARSGQAWCTYKSTPASSCTGGSNKGMLYKSVSR